MTSAAGRVFLLNTPDQERRVARDMAGGLGFDRSERMVLPPLDLLSLATVLRSRGYLTELLDAQVEDLPPAAIQENCRRFGPDVVILTASLPSLSEDAAFARALRQRLPPSARVAVKTGIPHPVIQERLLRESSADFLITGECDLTIDAVLDGRTQEGTGRLVAGRYQEVREPLLEDLDVLPIPDRGLLRNDRYAYQRLGSGTTTMQTSRGCPYSCGYYCPYPLVQGKKWRAMSAERVFRELREMVDRHGVRKVFFRDATFTLDKKRAGDLCRRIVDDGLEITWWCETRIDRLDEDLMRAMRAAGCAGMNVGIESGDDGLLAELAKVGIQRKDIVRFTRTSRDLGLRVHFLLMVGLPGETRKSLHETFTLVEEMEPESIGITSATPYPGTQLYDDAVRNGWIVQPDLGAFGGHGFNMDIGSVSPRDLEFAMERIHAVTKLKDLAGAARTSRREELRREFRQWVQG